MAGSVGLRVEGTETKERDRDEDGDRRTEQRHQKKGQEENGSEHMYVKKRKRMASSADDVEMEELAEGTVEDEVEKDVKMKMKDEHWRDVTCKMARDVRFQRAGEESVHRYHGIYLVDCVDPGLYSQGGLYYIEKIGR